MKKTSYRLGLDVGTNSLGWCVIGLNQQGEPERIVNAGARIFSDGRDSKTRETLKATRRLARSARRRRDRFKQRQNFLLLELEKQGLFPTKLKKEVFSYSLKKLNQHLKGLGGLPSDKSAAQDLQKLDPLELRARAVREKLTPFELGRALFHLNQRRGFQSNRKDASDADGKVAQSFDKLLYKMKLVTSPLAVKKEYKKGISKQEAKLIREKNKQSKLEQTKNRNQCLEKFAADTQMTYGVFLYNQQKQKADTRVRPSADDKLYTFYPMRLMYKDEFKKIMLHQQKHHPEILTPEVQKKLQRILFHQRPLKPAKRGRCAYLSNEDRSFRGMPSFQRYRILQEVNSLEWRVRGKKHKLTDYPKARDAVVQKLEQGTAKEIKWASLRREISKHIEGLSEREFKLNFETNGRTGFDTSECSRVLAQEDYIGPEWHSWSLDKQDQLVALLLDENLPDFNMQNEAPTNEAGNTQKSQSSLSAEDEDEKIKQKLMQDFKLDVNRAEQILSSHLPDDTAGLSLKAARALYTCMRDARCLQTEAVDQMAEKYKHFKNPARFKKDTENYQPEDQLEYYGKVFQDGRHIIPGSLDDHDRHDDLKYYGGVTNPTVHISLNQIRHVVNELIRRYGHPASIAIELGRDLPAGKQKLSEIKKEQNSNKKDNEFIDKELKKLGQLTNRSNRLRYKLWQELSPDDPNGRLCPFTGEKIGLSDLFSAKVEVEHLLPFSQTLDDSRMNKIVCLRRANRDKGNRSPFEAFGSNPKGYNWDAILQRIQTFPRRKQEKFDEDAMEKWLEDNKDFSARHLNDTRYIGRVAREYLEQICCIDKIDVVTGKLTSLLRKHWGLNNILRDREAFKKDPVAAKAGANVIPFPVMKNRDDHRHHAVDALVVGMTTRSILQRVATANAKAQQELKDLEKLFIKNDDGKSPIDPWPHFRMDAREIMQNIVVSHKIKRKSIKADLMQNSKYTKKQEKQRHPDATHLDATDGALHNDTAYGLTQDKDKVVVRKPVESFANKKHIEGIRDSWLREQFLKAFKKGGLEEFLNLAKQKGIKSLRKIENLKVIPIKDKDGSVYKSFKGDSNWGIEIYQYPKGHKQHSKWEGVVISRFEANQKDFQRGQNLKTKHPKSGEIKHYAPAKPIMCLQINDCVEIDSPSGSKKDRQIFRLQKVSQRGNMDFAPLHEANVDSRMRDKDDDFKYLSKTTSSLQKLKAQKVHISPTGLVQAENPKPRNKNTDDDDAA